jgi:transcription elongation factor SPT6
VTEHDKPSDSELGRQLSINNSEFFSDLDELLVNHVGAVVRKLDTLMQHEKYRPEGQLGESSWLDTHTRSAAEAHSCVDGDPFTDDYLNDQVRARPGSSAYGFSLDSERPGWAKLSFLSRPKASGGMVQTWASSLVADDTHAASAGSDNSPLAMTCSPSRSKRMLTSCSRPRSLV